MLRGEWRELRGVRWKEHRYTAVKIVVAVIIHRSVVVVHMALHIRVEILTQTVDSVAREDAEDFPLMLVKVGRRFAAVDDQVLTQKSLYASQGKMREARAVIQECMNALVFD